MGHINRYEALTGASAVSPDRGLAHPPRFVELVHADSSSQSRRSSRQVAALSLPEPAATWENVCVSGGGEEKIQPPLPGLLNQ